VPYIAGFGQAAEEMWEMHEVLLSKMMSLKSRLVLGLQEAISGVYINGPAIQEGAAHIVNLRIEGVRSEVLLHALEDYGVYVSSGSACSSNKPEEKSPALHAIGLNNQQIEQSLRISFGRYNTEQDVDACISAMKTTIPMLRRFIRK